MAQPRNSGDMEQLDAGAMPTQIEFGRYCVRSLQRELLAEGAPVELGSRAFDILLVLIEARGALVTKDQLLSRVWPKAVVEENTLQSQIYALRKALGCDRDFIKTVPGRGYRFTGEIRTAEPAADSERALATSLPFRSAVRQLTNVPAALSQLIGRAAELDELLELLGNHRLVTLTGAGGIGKTRLALEVARGLLPRYPDGVWLVDLAPLSDPQLVFGTIVATLGLQSTTTQIAPSQLAAAFGSKHALLVLDNCEHVIETGAQVAEALLRAAPMMRIVATSREPLGVEGERVSQVPPLETPPERAHGIEEILQHAAVQLFVSRAQAVVHDFALDDQSAAAIATICRRLDGIPLAIELAAARTGGLSVDTIAGRLDDLFELLSRGRRAAPARHQTLKATLDWSYGLLPEDQRRVLRRVSVFLGGFTLAGASAVAADADHGESDTINAVTDLVAKSMIGVDMSGSQPRFRLLETTRAYALRRLEESGEIQVLRRRHAAYCRDLLAAAERDETAGGQWPAECTREIDNVRVALDWAFAPGGDVALGVTLAAGSAPLWMRLSLVGECNRWMDIALANLETAAARGTRAEMLLQTARSSSLFFTGATRSQIETAMIRALELARTLGDRDYQLRALFWLYCIHQRGGDCRAALSIARQAQSLVHDIGEQVIAPDIWMGYSLYYVGELQGARMHVERVLEECDPVSRRGYATRFGHDPWVSAFSIRSLVLWLQGFPDQAVRSAARGVEEAREINHAVSLCHALCHGACVVALRIGDLSSAEGYTERFRQLAEELPSTLFRAHALGLKGLIAARRGRLSESIELLGTTLGYLAAGGFETLRRTFLVDYADVLREACWIKEGLATIDEVQQGMEERQTLWRVAEILRIKGELLLLRNPSDVDAAQDCFERSLLWARRQGALSLELRTAMSLARSEQDRRHGQRAHELLAQVYARFTEGFETADLRCAKALLEGSR